MSYYQDTPGVFPASGYPVSPSYPPTQGMVPGQTQLRYATVTQAYAMTQPTQSPYAFTNPYPATMASPYAALSPATAYPGYSMAQITASTAKPDYGTSPSSNQRAASLQMSHMASQAYPAPPHSMPSMYQSAMPMPTLGYPQMYMGYPTAMPGQNPTYQVGSPFGPPYH